MMYSDNNTIHSMYTMYSTLLLLNNMYSNICTWTMAILTNEYTHDGMYSVRQQSVRTYVVPNVLIVGVVSVGGTVEVPWLTRYSILLLPLATVP